MALTSNPKIQLFALLSFGLSCLLLPRMSLRVARIVQRTTTPVYRTWTRSFSDEYMAGRERSAEKEYISKQERDQLRALLAKLDKSADPTKGNTSRTKLHVIFEKYNQKLTGPLEAELRAWKNDGHHTPEHK